MAERTPILTDVAKLAEEAGTRACQKECAVGPTALERALVAHLEPGPLLSRLLSVQHAFQPGFPVVRACSRPARMTGSLRRVGERRRTMATDPKIVVTGAI